MCIPEGGEDAQLDQIYRTALTMQMMDPSQTDYYTDYCIVGVSSCSAEELLQQAQPTDPADVKKQQLWLYVNLAPHTTREIQPRFAKLILQPTEDQKQILTGPEELYNKTIQDDCETSATESVAVQQELMKMENHMVYHNWWTGVGEQATMAGNIDDLILTFVRKNCKDNRLDEKGNIRAVMTLVKTFMKYDMSVDLCVGSATAAQEGEAGEPGQYCIPLPV
jgi:hypothetical protein